jgi:hypothetical protein
LGKAVGAVVTFAGTENENCVLDGFTVTGGLVGGILGNGAYASVRNCIVAGNIKQGPGAGIHSVYGLIDSCKIINNDGFAGGALGGCHGTISNCIFTGNSGIASTINNCDGDIINCTVANNTLKEGGLGEIRACDGTIQNCIIVTENPVFDICNVIMSYSCWPEATGEGNIDVDPMFIDADNDDYHLLADSMCIDAGNPASDYTNEPVPNGSRVNMGVYGNTTEASLSRDGLVPLGFEIVSKTRTGRTIFEYELSVIVHNTNPHDMMDVRMQLMDYDDAVLSVTDDLIVMDHIGIDEIKSSHDTFSLTIDRSKSITVGRLTWELTYYVQGQGQSMSQMTILLSEIDSVPGDITGEGDVNMDDLAAISEQWQDAPSTPSADIALPLNGYVGIEDLLFLAENWLVGLEE